MRLVVCALAVSLAGCQIDGACETDRDCSGDLVCDATRSCNTAAAAPSWQITWLVNGEAVRTNAPGDCIEIDEFALIVRSSRDGEELAFRPVRCELGLFLFRALPTRFDRLTLEVHDRAGLLTEISARREGPEAALEIQF